MKALLIFPPQAQPFLPHPATPQLTAVLKREGVDVTQWDLNLEAYEHFLSPEVLTGLGMDPTAAASIHEAMGLIRCGTETFDLQKYYYGIFSMRDGLSFVSGRFPGLRWDLKHFALESYSSASWDEICTATVDATANPFVEYFEKRVQEAVRESKPDLVGISVAWRDQVIPAFTLARLFKKYLPSAHVCMGGSMISHWAGYLQYKRKMFSWVDSFLPYEGEIGVVALAKALQGGRLEDVPGLIYPQKKKVACNPPELPRDLADVPVPDYEGLHLERYLSPRVYLPVSTSRACYWAKCSFCSHHISGSSFRQRRAEDVVAEMDLLHERHGCLDFYLSDDSLPPALGTRLAKLIAEGGRPYRWVTELRLEPMMDRAWFDHLYAGGCRLVLFGMESHCQRVLDLMQKGVREEQVGQVIRDASDAGIITWVFFFVGFPGETEAEARQTLDFLVAHREHIDMVAGGTFILTRNSEVFKSLEKYCIEKIAENPKLDLRLTYPYLLRENLRWDATKLLEGFWARSEVQGFLEPFVVEPHLLYFGKAYFRQKARAQAGRP